MRYLLAHWNKRKLLRYSYRLTRHYERVLKLKSKSEEIDVLELAARWIYFNNKCCFCGDGRRTVQIDHLIPVSKGGEHVLQNLFPCCKRCNRSKSAKGWEEWYLAQAFYNLEREIKVALALKSKDPGSILPHVKGEMKRRAKL